MPTLECGCASDGIRRSRCYRTLRAAPGLCSSVGAWLQRIHRYLQRQGVAAQHSLFSLSSTARGMPSIIDALRGMMEPAKDDIRAYHLPATCPVWILGNHHPHLDLHGTAWRHWQHRSPLWLPTPSPLSSATPSASPWQASGNRREQANTAPRSRGD